MGNVNKYEIDVHLFVFRLWACVQRVHALQHHHGGGEEVPLNN